MASLLAVREILAEARRLGFLGDRPVDDVIEHSRAFVDALDGVTGSVVDLGSGGGVPGLVVAHDRPDLHVTLVDRRSKRTDFLIRVVRRIGWQDRVNVVTADAERYLAGRDEPFSAAIARGFGPPATTLRTAVRGVGPGGRIIVSEPPSGDRWPSELLAELGVRRRDSDPRVARFDVVDA